MKKNDFLVELRRALEAELPHEELMNHLAFYEEFIEKEMAQGKSEKEVLDSLGNPRLIAKTIIDTYKLGKGPFAKETNGAHNHFYDESEDNMSGRRNQEDTEQGNVFHYIVSRIPWYYKVAGAFALIIILFIFICIGGILLSLALKIGLPLLLLWLLLSFFVRQRH